MTTHGGATRRRRQGTFEAAAAFHARLGADFYRRGLHTRAAQEFRRALVADPASADVHNHLAIALNAQGLCVEAAAALRRALTLDPAHADARRNLALTLRAVGRGEELPPGVTSAHVARTN